MKQKKRNFTAFFICLISFLAILPNILICTLIWLPDYHSHAVTVSGSVVDCVDNADASEISITDKVETTIVSTGLTIIGIAISVWAGLHIIQFLENKKYEKLSDMVNEYAEERRIRNRESFLNLLKNKSDLLNVYLYNECLQIPADEYSSLEYFQMNEIELIFDRAYTLHYARRKWDAAFIRQVKEQIAYMKKLVAKNAKKRRNLFHPVFISSYCRI